MRQFQSYSFELEEDEVSGNFYIMQEANLKIYYFLV